MLLINCIVLRVINEQFQIKSIYNFEKKFTCIRILRVHQQKCSLVDSVINELKNDLFADKCPASKEFKMAAIQCMVISCIIVYEERHAQCLHSTCLLHAC